MTVVGAPSPAVRRRRGLAQPQGQRIGRAVGAILMTLCAAGTAIPLLLLLINGLKTTGQIVADPLALPTSLQWHNLSDAWQGGDFGAPLSRSFLNSVIVTTGSVVAVTLIAALAGYALGGFTFRGERYVTLGILVLLAVPTQATLVPIFDMMGTWNLRNTYLGLIAVYTAFWMPFSVLLMRAAFRSFPRELVEAARVDGARELGIFFRIVVPILRGPIAGVAIINAIGIWSELLFAYVLMTEPGRRTLPSAIIAFQGAFLTDFRLLYAGLIISVIPVLIFYASLSGFIRKGMSAGSLK